MSESESESEGEGAAVQLLTGEREDMRATAAEHADASSRRCLARDCDQRALLRPHMFIEMGATTAERALVALTAASAMSRGRPLARLSVCPSSRSPVNGPTDGRARGDVGTSAERALLARTAERVCYSV